MRKTDARSIRTKAAIRAALEKMIVEGRREDITVTALAARAGIHRKTFYLHYDSIETLLDDFAMNVIEDIIEAYREGEGVGKGAGDNPIAGDGFSSGDGPTARGVFSSGEASVVRDGSTPVGTRDFRIDFKRMNEAFFKTVSANPTLHKRLFCDPDYRFLHDRINSLGTGLFSKMIEPNSPNSAEMNIILSIMSSGILAAWDAWYRIGGVSEDRLSELIDTAMGDAADLFSSLRR